ncbi:hypothetical protein, partial [Paramuribaculum intestinale]|uniref:hypothetical protein n=1 Tax=Paramuribaculum intestinale TaxID=2094151 RepID=UPI003F49AE55
LILSYFRSVCVLTMQIYRRVVSCCDTTFEIMKIFLSVSVFRIVVMPPLPGGANGREQMVAAKLKRVCAIYLRTVEKFFIFAKKLSYASESCHPDTYFDDRQMSAEPLSPMDHQ